MAWNLAWLLPGECIPGIVHDAVEVIDFSQRVHLPRFHLQKVILLSCERKKWRSTVEIWGWVILCILMYRCRSKVKTALLWLKNIWYNTDTKKHFCRLRMSVYPTDVIFYYFFFTFINLLLDFSNIIAERPVLLPGWMLSLIMLTCSSLSGRVCSCQNPITWPNSWTTMPNLSQFFPMDMACGPPPRRPT